MLPYLVYQVCNILFSVLVLFCYYFANIVLTYLLTRGRRTYLVSVSVQS